jgi:hypothetical protein
VAAQVVADPDEPPVLSSLAFGLSDSYPQGRFFGSIFASETTGDYLHWALAPHYPVLIYTHVHLFSSPYWQQCRAVKAGYPIWSQVLDLYDVNLIVVEAELYENLCKLVAADPRWLTVVNERGNKAKHDPRGRLFVALRKNPSRKRADSR